MSKRCTLFSSNTTRPKPIIQVIRRFYKLSITNNGIQWKWSLVWGWVTVPSLHSITWPITVWKVGQPQNRHDINHSNRIPERDKPGLIRNQPKRNRLRIIVATLSKRGLQSDCPWSLVYLKIVLSHLVFFVKAPLHWTKANEKTKYFLWCLPLFSFEQHINLSPNLSGSGVPFAFAFTIVKKP